MISAICNFKDKPFKIMRKYHLCKAVAIFADINLYYAATGTPQLTGFYALPQNV